MASRPKNFVSTGIPKNSPDLHTNLKEPIESKQLKPRKLKTPTVKPVKKPTIKKGKKNG